MVMTLLVYLALLFLIPAGLLELWLILVILGGVAWDWVVGDSPT